jgi:D-alanyl-D-alanine carboxypeptidase/D-alanyl-D-alanine-endopeptidase (penicillin-binding protein 4)
MRPDRPLASRACGRRARSLLLAVCAASIAALPAPTALAGRAPARPAAAPIDTVHALPRPVEAALARGGVPREAMVAWVQEVDAARPRLAFQPDKPVNPASLMKLVTTFAALELLGPAYTWSTPVWLQGTVEGGVLNGNLVIRGSGDPKLVLERIWLLLRRVQQAGVREIRGDIVLDRSALSPGESNPADFDGEPLRPYNVGADALLLNYRAVLLTLTPEPGRGVATIAVDPPLAGVQVDATVPLVSGPCEDWRGALKSELDDPARIRFTGAFPVACGEKVWPLAYADPTSYNARVIAGLWAEQGGKLTGVVRDGSAPALTPSFELRSPTLAEVIRDINKLSNNVMAQQLFLTLGATQRGAGTPEAARDVLRQWLKERVGSASSVAVISNGSGLSRDSRLSAALLGRLLQVAWSSPMMAELMSSLPVAGIDGTLRRAKGTPGRAHLKTGSLRDVVGIAGYVLADSGRRYVVVGIVNHANANAARPALEALAGWAASDASALAPGAPEPN